MTFWKKKKTINKFYSRLMASLALVFESGYSTKHEFLPVEQASGLIKRTGGNPLNHCTIIAPACLSCRYCNPLWISISPLHFHLAYCLLYYPLLSTRILTSTGPLTSATPSEEKVGNALQLTSQRGAYFHVELQHRNKQATDRWDPTKLKSFCTAKEIVNWMKRQPIEWD